jgi:hypothetical protein
VQIAVEPLKLLVSCIDGARRKCMYLHNFNLAIS